MKFDDLDQAMRRYEQSVDQVIEPEHYLVARLDGHHFTKLTKEICPFEAPFDPRFKDMMAETVKTLMNAGFRVVYGYTESDEISLLFHPEEDSFGRKIRKFNSILAGTASAAFSLQLGLQAVFDCRMVPLPDMERVRDYFLWRQEDANRNARNAHCYWMLRKAGRPAAEAAALLDRRSIAEKDELLRQNGIDFDSCPAWQRRGIGVYWTEWEKKGFNPVSGLEETAKRRSLFVNEELPRGKAYGALIDSLLQNGE